MDITSELVLTYNARALTDLPLAGGGSLASRVLYRSDGLSALTDVGLSALGVHGIGAVIDLRTDAERAAAPDILPADGSVRLIEQPVLGGDMVGLAQRLTPAGEGEFPSAAELTALADTIPTIDELYLSILRGGAPQFARIARAVLEADGTDRGAVLFHCTAGKDRTGVAAALLLEVAGVERDAIIADYTLTGENLARGFAEHMLAMLDRMGIPRTPKLTTLATESPASAIVGALDWVVDQHGDAAGYLASGGLTEEETRRLRGTLRGEPVTV